MRGCWFDTDTQNKSKSIILKESYLIAGATKYVIHKLLAFGYTSPIT